jgi:heme-degrading monooxygenase HmoA
VIARIWHGLTLAEKADDYLAFLRARAVPDYQATPGNLSVEILHRTEGALTHYLVVTRWSSVEAIAAFAGEDIARARYYPEDRRFLLEFEPTVQHFTVAP